MRRLPWLLPFAAFLAVLPLALGGDSCGKDFTFHMQSWLGAAEQLRHGALYPRWNFLAAYNAGDPRFVFYPPLSWMLGAVLSLCLPFWLVPTALTWIILTLAGWTMFRLTRAYVPEPIAFLAGCVYLANPFMLWTVTGRNAYAELLAAAFCPLLLAAMLAPRPSPWRIGLPLALMWLSNVPGGAIGTYLVIFLATFRLVLEHLSFINTTCHLDRRPRLCGRSGETPVFRTGDEDSLRRTALASRELTPMPLRERLTLQLFSFLVYAGGLLYGFALAGFFLVPALWERRYIHMSEAFGTHLRPTDNLFFHRAMLPTDDFFLRTERIGISLALAVLIAFAATWLRAQPKQPLPAEDIASPLRPLAALGISIATLSLAIVFMTTFLAAPIWRHIPVLWVVQFPWRLLFVLGACFAVAIALAARDLPWPPYATVLLSLVIVGALAFPLIHQTRTVCTSDRTPRAIQADLLRHHTPEPTDEYVVATGDPDFVRPDNPPFWLASTPTAYAPGTTPNPAAADPTREWPLVPEHAALSATPLHFTVTAPAPSYLVVNLQDYPNWRMTLNNKEPLAHLSRPDGLLTVALPAGTSSLSIAWHHTAVEYLGWVLTAIALLVFHAGRRRGRDSATRPPASAGTLRY